MRRLNVLTLLPLTPLLLVAQTPTGIFEDHGDVGTVLHAGSVDYNEPNHSYTLTGSGDNVWAAADAFQFVWKKVSGDVTLTADISILGQGGDPHKKAMLMVRQSLDADSPYADAALHGVGLTSLQAREEKGAATHEVQSNVSAPKRLRLVKREDNFYMYIAGEGEPLHMAGGSMRAPMRGTFYVGIGICAHNKDVVEKAVFTNVELTAAPAALQKYSTIETITVQSTDARVSYVSPEPLASPNWTHDGLSLLFNGNGKIQSVPVDGGDVEGVDTGFAAHCDNNHGISPDGNLLAFTDKPLDGGPAIFVVPLSGGTPRRVTQNTSSFFHGWSPDGKTIVFSGERNGKTAIYTIMAADSGPGGQEKLVIAGAGANDNPEYSPDGKYIYFNSDRSGSMQIWRMLDDGSNQEQITSDEFGNWRAHISPDGRQLAFLSYAKGVIGSSGNAEVTLRVISLTDKRIRALAKLTGGPGTLDSPSWSPDSRRLAFVSYQTAPAPQPPR